MLNITIACVFNGLILFNMGKMVHSTGRSALHLGTITNGNALIQPVYVKVPHCQCAQMFRSMFHSDEKSSGNGIDLYILIVISTG
jgi:hypothetical protein